MKITKKHLKRIIKEEIQRVLEVQVGPNDDPTTLDRDDLIATALELSYSADAKLSLASALELGNNTSLASNSVNAKILGIPIIARGLGGGNRAALSGIQDKSPSIELEVDGQLLGKEESLQMYIAILEELSDAARSGEFTSEFLDLTGYENILQNAPLWKYGNPKNRNEEAALGLLAYADVTGQIEDWGKLNQIDVNVDHREQRI